MNTPARPTEIRLRKSAGVLAVTFDSGEQFELPFEYLRVFSPSAEVRGHGAEILQIGKEKVKVIGVEPVGNYAVRLKFDDGHDTGLVFLAGAAGSRAEPHGQLATLSQTPAGSGLPAQDLNWIPFTHRAAVSRTPPPPAIGGRPAPPTDSTGKLRHAGWCVR